MIKKFQEERDIFLYCDFHGHSRRKNVFMYGCNSNKPGETDKEKIFPKLLSMNCSLFSFPDSCFDIQKSKESTARVVIWREFGIMNSYTLEASFCGADFEKFVDYHFNREMLEEVGRQFCETISDFCDLEQTKLRLAMEELEIPFLDREADVDALNSNSSDSGESEEENDKHSTKKKKGKKKTRAKEVQPPLSINEDSVDPIKKNLKAAQAISK
eukprot:TRINITY_DN2112_c0_g1_i16.p1 TRINITY_DN2112_c0_g1~~TRINITY_DN2112_c0_g1_i16.p1  ORF type:complete len:214 (+),score=55.71 TRINITY_DN2112_c0_g1_i16:121-762(+)